MLTEHTLKRSDWPTVVEGRYLIAIPSLRSVLQEFEYNSSDLRIEIRYPGGDAGNVWALEVHSWLIAMGLASTDIVLEPGSGDPQALKLQAVRRID